MADILDFAAAKAAKQAKNTYDIPGLQHITTGDDVDSWVAQLADFIELTFDESIVVEGPEMDRMLDKIRDVIMESFDNPEYDGDLVA